MGRADGRTPSRGRGLDGPRSLPGGADTAQHRARAGRDGLPGRRARRRGVRRHRAAAELLAAEAGRTRQRVRAPRRHWIPRLRRELAALEPALEETEHEEAVRRRWAAAHGAR
ncbi:V-type ATP synthase subunit D [Streptomyces sp. NPDC001165]|uniref:V-type ATP synthase subunit D n=1 Tax=Streptomyces sp. NPDC001165 TaxID=3364546 RepID=UPI00367E61B8